MSCKNDNNRIDLFALTFQTEKHLSKELFCITMRNKVSIMCSIIMPLLRNIISLMLSGDVQTSLGLSFFYHDLCEKVSQRSQKIKFFYMKVGNMTNKHSLVTSVVNDVGAKTIFRISETWLTQSDGHNLWSIDASTFKCYRCDRSTSIKEGCAVFVLVPSSLVSRIRPHMETFSGHLIDSLWIDFNKKINR